jgi:hypothetical protein
MQRYFRNHLEADLDCTTRIVRNSDRQFLVRNPIRAFRQELARRAGGVGSRHGIRVLCIYRTGRIARRLFKFAPAGLEASFQHSVIERSNGQLIVRTSPFNFVLRFGA